MGSTNGYYTATGSAWQGWVSVTTNATTAATTAACTYSDAWQGWQYAGTGSASSNYVFREWVETSDEVGYTVTTAPAMTQEERQAQEQRNEVMRLESEKRYKEVAEKQKLAREKALKLLMANLNQDQIDNYEKNKCIDVDTPSGNRYRIEHGRAGNVFQLDKAGKKTARFCIHPDEYIPDEDTVLAQKLFLQHNEQAFLSKANKTQLT